MRGKRTKQTKLEAFSRLSHIPLDKKYFSTTNRVGRRPSFEKFGGSIEEHTQQLIESLEKSINKSKERRNIYKDDETYFRIKFYNLLSFYEDDLIKLGLRLIQVPDEKIAIVALSDSNEENFMSSFKVTTKLKYIEKIDTVELEEKIDIILKDEIENLKGEEKIIEIEFRFLPNLSKKKYDSILESISKHLRENEEIKYRVIQEEFGKTHMKLYTSSVMEILNGVDSILNVSTPSTYEIRFSSAPQDVQGYRNFHPHIPSNAPCVCIIDSGITTNHPLLETVIEDCKDYTPETHDGSDNLGHGTAVAGIAAYGENLRNIRPSNPDLRVIMAKVLHTDGEEEEKVDLENKLPRIVNAFIGKTKVFNLSINGRKKDMELASVIDNLEKNYGCLFVISTGNIPLNEIEDFLNKGIKYPRYFDYDSTIIWKPAEASCALTVGSIAKVKEALFNNLAENDQASPFTRRGPSPDNRLKPDVVAHGGNLLHMNTASGMKVHINDTISLRTLNSQYSSALFTNMIGTSFSAPLVSRLATHLFNTYSDASVNLIKALIINSALIKRKDTHDLKLGYGEIDTEIALSSKQYRVSYLIESEVRMDKERIIDFRIPRIMQKIKGEKRIYFTLVYDPPINLYRSYYTLIGLELSLEPSGRGKREFDASKKHWAFRCGERFDTVKTGIFNWHKGGWGKNWKVYIRPYKRAGDIDDDYTQKFALIITVEDPNANIDIYDGIINELRISTPSLIRVTERIPVLV